jgi:lysophospholipase L1-like esterase
MSTRVACVGDSITRAQISVDYIEMLEARMAGNGITFSRFGVNGDFAYNLRQRLEPIIAGQPDVITILIGTNDARASLDPSRAKRMMKRKNLPRHPSADWYRENLVAVIERLRAETQAGIALLSLPVLGQDLHAPPAETTREYSRIVELAAEALELAYLPLHERQVAYLGSCGAPPLAYREAAHPLLNGTLAQHFVLRRSLDDISRRRRLALTTDFIHQNSRGAGMIADLIERHLVGESPRDDHPSCLVTSRHAIRRVGSSRQGLS